MFDSVILQNLSWVAFGFVLLWGVSLLLRDASIVDPIWGLGFALLAGATYLGTEQASTTATVILTLVCLWGVRLSGYLSWRNWGEPEDRRYQDMRKKHGNLFPIVSLFTVFLLQAVLMWVIALPVQMGILRGGLWQPIRYAGVLLWLVGLCFESIGDYQLARFKADPKNKGEVLNRGLWRYTRHPNYFGDFLVWWGIYFVAVEQESWWWTLVGPLLMSWLLIRVSGVRLLEGSLNHRIDGYSEYQRTTSAFLPMPPKDSDSRSTT